jgi:hypothetical protein
MRKFAICLAILALSSSCVTARLVQPIGHEPSAEVVQKVKAHTLSVATIYAMSEEEWSRRVSERNPGVIWRRDGNLQQIIPIQQEITGEDGKPIKFLAYIGAATLLKDNYAITVSHLFDHSENTQGYLIWAFMEGLDRVIECELVARGNIDANWMNDYAVIKLKEDLGLPGLKIAKVEPNCGDLVIYSGSVGGLAFFTRFGRITQLQAYFNVGSDGKLHLSPFGEGAYWIVYPSGNGDSGGSIKNLDGEIIGIMYVGVTVYDECYVFSNRLEYLWYFLKAAKLEHLGE